jgi:hypothetical protein
VFKAAYCGLFLAALLLRATSLSAQNTTHPSGVLSGRAVDDEGRPMRGIQVQALVVDVRNGTRQMAPHGNAVTNDRGEFRLFWLEPGSYVVVMNPTPAPEVSFRQPSGRTLGYIPSNPDTEFVTTYFPGVSDVQKAEPVRLGRDEIDLDAIQVATLPTRLIRMRIVNPKLLDTFNYVPIATLQPLSDSTRAPSFAVQAQPRGNGEFAFRTGLLPGQYRLLVTALLPVVTYSGSAVLTVTGSDPDIIDVPVAPTISVQGQVVAEGAVSSLRIVCVPNGSRNSGMAVSSEVRSNGKFTLEDILPGSYAVSVDGLENDGYLSAVQLQGKDVSSTDIEFPKDISPLILTLNIKHDGGSIKGFAIDATGSPQPGAWVVMVPAIEFRGRRELFRFAMANERGEFEIGGIPPGNYTALPFVELERDAIWDAAFLKKFEGAGKPVSISRGDHLNLGSILTAKP